MIIHELRTCPECGQIVSVKLRKPNHVLHAILTLVSAGLWLPIWLLAMIEASFHRGRVKCPRGCKGRVK